MKRPRDGIWTARRPPRLITRRDVMTGALGVAGVSAIGAGLSRPVGGIAALRALAAAQETGNWLPEIPELTSDNGLLSLVLVAADDQSRGQGALGYALATDPAHPDSIARSPGPTLRLRRGDRLRLRLVNHLAGMTNLHVHGLHVSPSRNSDNVFVHVDAGDHGSFDFEYQIPEDHRSGLFWYHPHLHGTTQAQVQAGLAGAIIIEESEDDPAASKDEPPVVKGVPERLLVLQHLFPFSSSELFHVNGAIGPTIPFVPGDRERWRILNASSDTFLNLYLDGLEFYRVAVDGNWLNPAVPATILPLGPAERAEVVIDWGFAGSYTLSALDAGNRPVFVKTDTTRQVTLATLFRDDAAALFGATPVPRLVPADLLPLPDLRAVPAVPERELDFQFKSPGGLLIDGKSFVAGRVDQTVVLDGLEQWTIRNTSHPALGWHPLHIHVNDFQVVSISENELNPVWYTDTVPLPPDGNVVIRAVFPDFTGRFVYHCHFLGHEDAGMMGVVDVVKPVKIAPSGFAPEAVTVDAGPAVGHLVNSGTTVVWTNVDGRVHTVTADETDPLTTRPLFDSGDLGPNLSFAHTFDAPGEVAYHCAKHPEEQGRVVVTATKTVEILDFAFSPDPIAIAVGATVSWTNRDPTAHTIAADDLAFDSGPLSQGETFAHTFETPGEVVYQCAIHPQMQGTVTVKEVTRRSVSIAIVAGGLDQPEVTIPAGSTVTWQNRSVQRVSVVHETLFDSGTLEPERPFAPETAINPGMRFSHTFERAGTVEYRVVRVATPGDVQPALRGKVIVV